MNTSQIMPSPKVKIGMRIEPFALTAWHRKRILRSQISEHIRIGRNLRRDGYMKKTIGDMTILGDHAKQMIRGFMRVIDTAHTVEVAGVHAGGHHLGLSAVSDCYVGGSTGWSGMDFYPQLLWRATIEGNEVAVLQPISSVRHCFSQREITDRAILTMVAA